MSSIISAEKDKILSFFVTKKGLLRRERREAKQNIHLREKQHTALKGYVNALHTLNGDGAEKALVTYLSLLGTEIHLLTKSLHQDFQEYKKVLSDIKELQQELDRLTPEYKQQLGKTLNNCADIIEKGIMNVAKSISSLQSFSLSTFALTKIERESQIREEIGAINNTIKALQGYKKDFESLKKLLKNAEKHSAESTQQQVEKTGVTKTLEPFVNAIDKTVSITLVLLNEAHNDFIELLTKETPRPDDLGKIDIHNHPSIAGLKKMYAEGGYGMQATLLLPVDDLSEKIKKDYKKELDNIYAESRILASDAERAKQ